MTLRTTAALPVVLLLMLAAAPDASAQKVERWVWHDASKDPRYLPVEPPPKMEHPLINWVAGRIYMVRPDQPKPRRKAELEITRSGVKNILLVRRRTIGTTQNLFGTARLVKGSKWLMLEVRFTCRANGIVSRLTHKKPLDKHYVSLYNVRAKGRVLIGDASLPHDAEPFGELALTQKVAFRRVKSLINSFTERSAEDQKKLEELRKEPIVTNCWVSEYSASARDITSVRSERLRGVEFWYDYPEELGWSIKKRKPKHIFIIAHGWLNDSAGSQDFASQMIRGILARAERGGANPADVAFVFISWNSKRTIFMESAITAETIGHRGVAPIVKHLQREVPGASITLVGHSLGGRMMLSALQGPKKRQGWMHKKRIAFFRGMNLVDTTLIRSMQMALRGRTDPAPKVDAVVLLEAAADLDSLHAPVGMLNYGDFPQATTNVRILANCHSRNDAVLGGAYLISNTVMNPFSTAGRYFSEGQAIEALGRVGAERWDDADGAQHYPRLTVAGGTVDSRRLGRALSEPMARPPNAPLNRAINVDVGYLLPKEGDTKPKQEGGGTWTSVESHTLVFQKAIFDLIWQVTERGAALRN